MHRVYHLISKDGGASDTAVFVNFRACVLWCKFIPFFSIPLQADTLLLFRTISLLVLVRRGVC